MTLLRRNAELAFAKETHVCPHGGACYRDEEQEEGEGDGNMQQELNKLADDLVQKFEDQWKATAENLDAASKAFDNLDGIVHMPV